MLRHTPIEWRHANLRRAGVCESRAGDVFRLRRYAAHPASNQLGPTVVGHGRGRGNHSGAMGIRDSSTEGILDQE
jgi:hypothetical protein